MSQQEGGSETRSAASLLETSRRRREISGLPYSGLVDRDYEQDIRLKKWYAISVLIALGVQIVAANTIFVLYAQVGVHWRIDVAVMQAWLAATVVQVVGIVGIVTRYLFPRRRGRSSLPTHFVRRPSS